jgi:cation transport protein ChaC
MAGGTLLPAGGDVWVFAYGSLMWKPDFAFAEARLARLHGYHRALCIYSIRGRGTDDKPGLVLGLDRGGSCVGRAYRVMAADWEAVRATLHEREMVTQVYMPAFLSVVLDEGRRVTAYGFVARRDHVQYTGRLAEARMVELILQGTGPRGTSLDYLAQTVAQLDALGIRTGPLHRLLRRANATAAVPPV